MAATNKISFESSPAFLVANMTAPILLIQGDVDQEDSMDEFLGNVHAMRQHGLDAEIFVVPDEMHGLGLYEHQMMGYTVMADFLERNLLAPSHD